MGLSNKNKVLGFAYTIHQWLDDFGAANWRRITWSLFALALVIRFIIIFSLQDGFYFADGKDYVSAARHLVEHGSFSTDFARSPLYPVFLASIYSVFGDSLLNIRIAQAILGAGIVLLLTAIGARAGGIMVGFFAGLLWAIYPMGAFITGIIYPATLLAFLLVVAVLCLVTRPGGSRFGVQVFAAGLLLGLGALAKPIVLATVLYILVWICYEHRAQWKKLAALFVVGFLLVQLPWAIRNAIVHQRLVPIEARSLDKLVPWAPAAVKEKDRPSGKPASRSQKPSAADNSVGSTWRGAIATQRGNAVARQAGRAMHLQDGSGSRYRAASVAESDGTPNSGSPPEPAPAPGKPMPDVGKPAQDGRGAVLGVDAETLEIYRDSFLHMARRYPREFMSFFELYPRRVGYLQQSERDRAMKNNPRLVRYTVFGSDIVMLVSVFSVGSLYIFAIAGIYAMAREPRYRRTLRLLILMVLSFAMAYAISWGKIRYRIPVDPFIILMSAWGLAFTIRALARWYTPQQASLLRDSPGE